MTSTAETPALRVLMLSDGIPGHANTSRGIIAHLAQQTPLEMTEIVLPRTVPWLRPLANWLISKRLFALAGLILAWMHGLQPKDISTQHWDLIVAAGGNTRFLTAQLGARYGIKTVYASRPRKIPRELFGRTLTVLPVGGDNNITTPIMPTRMTPAHLLAAAGSVPNAPGKGPFTAVLIGGDGAGFHYSDRDYERIATILADHAERRDTRLLIAVSRRTSESGIRILQTGIPDERLFHGSWMDDAPTDTVAAYLGLARDVFCTADSMTMVMEAASANKPLGVLWLESASPSKEFQQVMTQLFSAGYGTRVSIEESKSSATTLAEPPPLDRPEWVITLLEWLGRKPN